MLERPYEEQEGECDVRKRSERDESRCIRVAFRVELRERSWKVPASAGGDGVPMGRQRARLPGFEPAQAQCLYFLGTQKVSFG